MNLKKKGKITLWLKKYWWILVSMALAIVIPIVVNKMLYGDTPTPEGLDNSDWLGFWGSYLGSALACVPAYFALHQSKKQAYQQHLETIVQQHQFEENQRLSVMPVFTIKLDPKKMIAPDYCPQHCAIIRKNAPAECFTPLDSERVKPYIQDMSLTPVDIQLVNVGLGSALRVSFRFSYDNFFINSISVGHIGKDSFCNLFVGFETGKTLFLEVQYADMFGNCYSQQAKFEYRKYDQTQHFSELSPPVSIDSID